MVTSTKGSIYLHIVLREDLNLNPSIRKGISAVLSDFLKCTVAPVFLQHYRSNSISEYLVSFLCKDVYYLLFQTLNMRRKCARGGERERDANKVCVVSI